MYQEISKKHHLYKDKVYIQCINTKIQYEFHNLIYESSFTLKSEKYNFATIVKCQGQQPPVPPNVILTLSVATWEWMRKIKDEMPVFTIFFFIAVTTNCLAYRYLPKFYNWLLVSLEKAQTTGTNQNFIIHCQYFSCCYLFVSLWHVFLLPVKWWWFNIFLFFVLWGLRVVMLLCLNSKKHKGSDSMLSLMVNYHKSYLHAYLCQNFWVNG